MRVAISRQQGLSLVEIMIASVLALSLLAVLLTTSSRQVQMSRETMQLAMLQQQGQLLLNLLQAELHQLGFWAGFSLDAMRQASAPEAMVVSECAIGSEQSGSFPEPGRPFIPLYSELGNQGGVSCLGAIKPDSAILQWKRLLAQPHHYSELAPNRYYLQIKADSLAIVDSSMASDAPEAEFWPYQHQLFYVQLQGDIPVLMRRRLIRNHAGQPRMHTDSVMDGVEILYFEFGIDSTLDGRANYFLPLHQMDGAQWLQQESRIVAISYYVLLRSMEPDRQFVNEQWYPMGQYGFQAPGDHYRRLALQGTQYFHNVALQLNGG
ncbi:PilW family protein [Alkalimonas delamerensis]|uniref:PilW family protein n=1 Tax=Alkalimonas delamerensis TaxID=265981 RepID=A0ABT9GS05_9GAMM|nr:PilW family protein [Alkalimonas delamerensis]MDP4529760.1 PilW family protein [Alkalimonas delamerensis]